ncbi:MAG: SpoIIE family protein phosphatase [Bacteroidia bacterium]|nr:SpoIIE family protein phosphatase [Bacteroidia bacterium]
MKPGIINGIILTMAILLWMVLLTFHLMQQVVSVFPEDKAGILVGGFWFKVSLVGFLLTNTLFISRIFANIEKLHVTTLLWRLFMIGMIGITVIMVITFANKITESLVIHKYLGPVFFGLGLYALLIFFLSAVFIFRRFILYPRTRRKMIFWRLFLGFLYLSLLFPFEWRGISVGVYVVLSYIPISIITLILSGNVRWIAYLNFNQKLRALGLFGLIMIVIITYLVAARRLPIQLGVTSNDYLNTQFFQYIILFSVIYSTFSILVLFFNLPTSSIFEMQSFEIASFSKINQSIQSNLDHADIMNTLLDASIMAANAKAGWIEMISEDSGVPEVRICKTISVKETQIIHQPVDLTQKILQDRKYLLVRNTRRRRSFGNPSGNTESRYRCLLGVPIISNSQAYGVIYVVNDLVNSFEDVTVQSLVSFAEQAGIALENAKLVRNSIELERYQEQLKIAKEVQNQLLPRNLPFSEAVEFIAMSENAQEVGGDYFDVIQSKEHIYKVAIGDVSGKGTTAAFYMAETKGIFHALARLELSVRQFIITANQALSECMQKGFFMTLTYLEINTQKREVEMIRAGHCPAFFYDMQADKIRMLREGTLGLGIVRDMSFGKFLQETQKIAYHYGDMLVLYTDGILEARNAAGEEYGYERLEAEIKKNKNASAAEVAAGIVNSVKDFAQADIDDDYTVLIIRFR